MPLRRLLLSLCLAPAVTLAQQTQAGSDGACPGITVDIAALTACYGKRDATPSPASSLHVAALPLQDVAPMKRSASGRHVAASEANRLRESYPGRIALLDIRAVVEVVYSGRPDAVDLHVPFREPVLPLQWSPATNGLKMQRNPDFADQVKAELARLDWPEDSLLLLLCRSGEMSAIAADVLEAAGLRHVFTVVDGFEGDLSANSRRDVNGWKNSGGRWHLAPAQHLAAATP